MKRINTDDSGLFSPIDDYVIKDICHMMDQQTLAHFALINKRINCICQQVIKMIALKFVKYAEIEENDRDYRHTALPPTSTKLCELIAHINGMTSNEIFINNYFATVCCVSGFYKNKWFRLRNDLTNKTFILSGQKGLQLKSLRARLVDEINSSEPKSFSISINKKNWSIHINSIDV